jgi:hypothetical protein
MDPLDGGHAMTDTRRNAGAALLLGVFAAALLHQNADAQADRKSANSMMPGCQQFVEPPKGEPTPVDFVRRGHCAGLVEGLTYAAYASGGRETCRPPSTVTNAQLVRVVLTYIERRPQRMHEDFRKLALEALHEAWPCPQ